MKKIMKNKILIKIKIKNKKKKKSCMMKRMTFR